MAEIQNQSKLGGGPSALYLFVTYISGLPDNPAV